MEKIKNLIDALPFDWKQIITSPESSKYLKPALEEVLKYRTRF